MTDAAGQGRKLLKVADTVPLAPPVTVLVAPQSLNKR